MLTRLLLENGVPEQTDGLPLYFWIAVVISVVFVIGAVIFTIIYLCIRMRRARQVVEYASVMEDLEPIRLDDDEELGSPPDTQLHL